MALPAGTLRHPLPKIQFSDVEERKMGGVRSGHGILKVALARHRAFDGIALVSGGACRSSCLQLVFLGVFRVPETERVQFNQTLIRSE